LPKGHNLFLLAVLGLIPFGFYSVIFACYRPSSIRIASGWCIAIGGLIAFWAIYDPAHVVQFGILFTVAPSHPRR